MTDYEDYEDEDLLFEIEIVESAIKQLEQDTENALDLIDPYADLDVMKKELAELMKEKERRIKNESLH